MGAGTARGLRWCLGLKVEIVTAQSASVEAPAVALVVAATNRHCSVKTLLSHRLAARIWERESMEI